MATISLTSNNALTLQGLGKINFYANYVNNNANIVDRFHVIILETEATVDDRTVITFIV